MGKNKEKGTKNPTDIYRKQLRKKELKKNREQRKKVREGSFKKKDTSQILNQIQKIEKLEQEGKLDKRIKSKKKHLLEKLEIAKKTKELSSLPPTREQFENAMTTNAPKSAAALERENRANFPNPEQSIYYHPIYNPFGAPPPGKPMLYKPSISSLSLVSQIQNNNEIYALPSNVVTPPISPPPLIIPKSPTNYSNINEIEKNKKDNENNIPITSDENNITEKQIHNTETNNKEKSENNSDNDKEENVSNNNNEDPEIDLESIPLPEGPPPSINNNISINYSTPPPLPPFPPPFTPFSLPPPFISPQAPRFPPPQGIPMSSPFPFTPPSYNTNLKVFQPPASNTFSNTLKPTTTNPNSNTNTISSNFQSSSVNTTSTPSTETIKETPVGPQLPDTETEDPTILVPTSLRIRRDSKISTISTKNKISSTENNSNKISSHDKQQDDAYNQFMKDMKELGAF